MIGIAFTMLFGAKGKYLMLVSGIAFATILMIQGMALFCGLLSFSYATLDNIRSPIWVTDPIVAQVADNQPLRDTDISRVRSVPGVAWAAPLFVGSAQARVIEHSLAKQVSVVGLDATTFMGAPTELVAGRIEDLRAPDSVILDERGTTLLSSDHRRPLMVGDEFEMNDRTARVVGICKATAALGGGSYVFTTYDRAVQYSPGQRKMLSFILVIPDRGTPVTSVTAAIEEATGLRARTEDQFRMSTVLWTLENSPIPLVVGLIVGVGFLVGTVISGQTFYTFVAENTRYLGALKAMGTENQTLVRMILAQAGSVGLVGYGVGIGVISLVFFIIPPGRAPLLLLWPVPLVALGAVLLICLFSAMLAVRNVVRLEPAIVFRG